MRLSGNLKEVFQVNKYIDNIGYAKDHPHAICMAEDKIFFLSNDYHIYMMDDNSQRIISHPLADTLVNANAAGMKIMLNYYTSNEPLLKANWLVVGLHHPSDQTLSRTIIYDLYKSHRLNRNYSTNIEREAQDIAEQTFDFWNAPWTLPTVCQLTCPANNDLENQRMTLFFATMSGGNSAIQPYEITPYNLSNSGVLSGVDWNFVANFNQFDIPNGNHVNTLREPGVHPNLYAVVLERLTYGGDVDPDIGVFKDSMWQKFLPTKQDPDQFIDMADGYRVIWGKLNEVGYYFAPTIRLTKPRKPLNVQKMFIVYDPEGGV